MDARAANLTVTKTPDICTCAVVRDRHVHFITKTVMLCAAEAKAAQQTAGKVAA